MNADAAPLSGRVLVVEDDAPMRSFFAATLREAGFEVELATDGVGALRQLEHGSYAAMVLDLHLPQLDGLGVLRVVHRRDPQFLGHVILVSGLRLSEVAPVFAICASVPKPVAPARLVDVVRHCMARREPADRARAD